MQRAREMPSTEAFCMRFYAGLRGTTACGRATSAAAWLPHSRAGYKGCLVLRSTTGGWWRRGRVALEPRGSGRTRSLPRAVPSKKDLHRYFLLDMIPRVLFHHVMADYVTGKVHFRRMAKTQPIAR